MKVVMKQECLLYSSSVYSFKARPEKLIEPTADSIFTAAPAQGILTQQDKIQ